MQNNVSIVPLKKIGTLVKREVVLSPFEEYRTVGCKLYGLGVYERETKTGGEIASSKMFHIRKNDFLINRIWAQKGSVGIVPPELDGAVVTNDFPVIQLNFKLILPKYLDFFVRTQQFWNECRKHSHGTSGRERLSPKDLMDIEIPLPSLKTQQCIVTTLEHMMVKIEELRVQRAGANNNNNQLIKAELENIFSTEKQIQYRYVRDAIIEHKQGYYSTAKFLEGPIHFIRISDINDDCYLNYESMPRIDIEESAFSSFEVKPYDFLFARTGGAGRFALATEGKKCIFASYLIRFRFKSDYLPEFLRYFFLSSMFQKDICSRIHGGANQNVHAEDIKNAHIPILSGEEQRRIVAHLDRLQAKVDEVKRLQAETEREMEALVPALLAKAFC